MTVFDCASDPCENDIIVTDANGANPLNVTRGHGQDGRNKSKPSWSPEGHQIAFELDCGDGCIDIATVALDGADIVDLTPELGDASDPAWSPDNARIAFARTICDNTGCHTAIFVVGATTPSKIARLSPVLAGTASGPAWSRRGGRIVFSIFRCVEGCASDLLQFQTNGSSAPVNLTANLGADATAPTWAPNGLRIAFTEGDCSEGCSPLISLIDPDTGNNHEQLARGRNPTWR